MSSSEVKCKVRNPKSQGGGGSAGEGSPQREGQGEREKKKGRRRRGIFRNYVDGDCWVVRSVRHARKRTRVQHFVRQNMRRMHHRGVEGETAFWEPVEKLVARPEGKTERERGD
jgi:hypothetical protein